MKINSRGRARFLMIFGKSRTFNVGSDAVVVKSIGSSIWAYSVRLARYPLSVNDPVSVKALVALAIISGRAQKFVVDQS
jgi:hypothetical protein